ncbi:MAG TPA: response regulator [Myxococcales bacterium]
MNVRAGGDQASAGANTLRRVLVIEDDPSLRETLCSLLTSHGYACVAAKDGEEALQRLSEQVAPDLVVLDLFLPRFDGWNLIAVLQGLAPIPILATSGLSDSRSRRLAQGATTFMQKPFDLDAFLSEVERLCPARA